MEVLGMQTYVWGKLEDTPTGERVSMASEESLKSGGEPIRRGLRTVSKSSAIDNFLLILRSLYLFPECMLTLIFHH